MDAIICDPPYGTVKGMGGDIEKYKRLSNSSWDVTLDTAEMFSECERILRENGKLILFSQEPYTSKIITEAHGNLPFNYRLIWLKDHFANCLVANKAPVSYFEDIVVFTKKYDTLGLNPLRIYFKQILDYVGLNLKEINRKLGHRKAEHTFYVTPKKALIGEIDNATRYGSMQFGLCTKETYQELIDTFEINKMDGFKDFDILKELNLKQESTFNLHEGHKKKSNVLSFKKDYEGLHPTQKPVYLMEDLVYTYTNEGDKVLDFTCGSGSTGVACKNLKRNFIGIEMDEKYCQIARNRLKDNQTKLEDCKSIEVHKGDI
jgi:site-specific DNA-methyltransferase (adenine-specific)